MTTKTHNLIKKIYLEFHLLKLLHYKSIYDFISKVYDLNISLGYLSRERKFQSFSANLNKVHLQIKAMFLKAQVTKKKQCGGFMKQIKTEKKQILHQIENAPPNLIMNQS